MEQVAAGPISARKQVQQFDSEFVKGWKTIDGPMGIEVNSFFKVLREINLITEGEGIRVSNSKV